MSQENNHTKMAIFKVLFLVCAVVIMEVKGDAKCECGVFKSPTPDTIDKAPVASKAPQFNFECNADGKKSCLDMCVALAGASKEDGPKKLCEIIKDASEAFVPLVYYRACDDTNWTYTGLKPTLEVCCKAGSPIACA